MFTDDGAILADGLIYARICVGFCFGPFIHICIEKIFQATGKMIFPMALQAIGAILNIITFDQVLAVNNDKMVVGNPTVEGATVDSFSVVENGKARKLSFTSTRENPVIIRKTVTDSSTQQLRLKRSTLNLFLMIKVTIYKTEQVAGICWV